MKRPQGFYVFFANLGVTIMSFPDEKDLWERFIKIRNNSELSYGKIKDKFDKIDYLEKTFWEHMKACEELQKGMPTPGDTTFLKQGLNYDQRKRLFKYKKHEKAMNRCREKMNILLNKIENERKDTYTKAVSDIMDGKQLAKSMMIDTIKEEAYRLAKEKIHNASLKK